jgi:hypothetical protein
MRSTLPFPATREERATKEDPRRSSEERYPSRVGYLEQVGRRLSASPMKYLLTEDLELFVGQAPRRYELLALADEPVAAKGLVTASDREGPACQTVAQAQRYIAVGYSVVVDLDLEKFFAAVAGNGLPR